MICTSGGVADLIAETAAISGDAISRRSGPQTARRHHTAAGLLEGILSVWGNRPPSPCRRETVVSRHHAMLHDGILVVKQVDICQLHLLLRVSYYLIIYINN